MHPALSASVLEVRMWFQGIKYKCVEFYMSLPHRWREPKVCFFCAIVNVFRASCPHFALSSQGENAQRVHRTSHNTSWGLLIFTFHTQFLVCISFSPHHHYYPFEKGTTKLFVQNRWSPSHRALWETVFIPGVLLMALFPSLPRSCTKRMRDIRAFSERLWSWSNRTWPVDSKWQEKRLKPPFLQTLSTMGDL